MIHLRHSPADYETAVIPPERRQHLSRFDATAAHYDVPPHIARDHLPARLTFDQ